jgi:malate dehydrogenase
MIRAVLFDEQRIVPCSAYLDGQYGVRNLYVGVPAVLGGSGIEKVIELELNEVERADFDRSVAAVKDLMEKLSI